MCAMCFVSRAQLLVHLRCPFQGARRALADALDRKSSWRPAGNCWIPLIFCAASGGSKG
jgi:hypothetical protein